MTTCPKCGYVENEAKLMKSNDMNMYIDDSDPKSKLTGIYNQKDQFITIKGKKLRRSDVPKIEPAKPVEAKK